jgi:hypothetical protein
MEQVEHVKHAVYFALLKFLGIANLSGDGVMEGKGQHKQQNA